MMRLLCEPRYMRVWLALVLSGAALFTLSRVQAQGPDADSTLAHPQLSIRSMDIARSGDSLVSGTFIAENRGTGVVGGIDYVVSIISPFPKVEQGEMVSDNPVVYTREYVSANMSFTPGEVKAIDYNHALPPLPEGEYRIRIRLVSSHGRELRYSERSIALGGNASTFAEIRPQGVMVDSISPEAMFAPAVVEGEEQFFFGNPDALAEKSEWAPLEGVNVDPGADVLFRTQISNRFQSSFSGTLAAVVRRDLTTSSKPTIQDLVPVSLASRQTKTMDIPFTAPEEPGAYHILLVVRNAAGQAVSSLGEFRIVVRGPSASVVGIIADELRLEKGGITTLMVSVVGSADRETPVEGIASIELFDGEYMVGREETALRVDGGVHTANVRIKNDRTIQYAPEARVVMSDADGNILDEYRVEFSRDVAAAPSVFEGDKVGGGVGIGVLLAVLVVGVCVLAGYGVYRFRTGSSRKIGVGVIVFLAVTIGALAVYVPQSNAVHYLQQPVRSDWWFSDHYLVEQVGTSLFYKHTGWGDWQPDWAMIVDVSAISQDGNDCTIPDNCHVGDTVRVQVETRIVACMNHYVSSFTRVHLADNGGYHARHDNRERNNVTMRTVSERQWRMSVGQFHGLGADWLREAEGIPIWPSVDSLHPPIYPMGHRIGIRWHNEDQAGVWWNLKTRHILDRQHIDASEYGYPLVGEYVIEAEDIDTEGRTTMWTESWWVHDRVWELWDLSNWEAYVQAVHSGEEQTLTQDNERQRLTRCAGTVCVPFQYQPNVLWVDLPFLFTHLKVRTDPRPPNTLMVKSYVDGSEVGGVVMTRPDGLPGDIVTSIGGYSFISPHPIVARITAPTTIMHNGKDARFERWDSCTGIGFGSRAKDCNISVSGGNMQSVSVHYGTVVIPPTPTPPIPTPMPLLYFPGIYEELS